MNFLKLKIDENNIEKLEENNNRHIISIDEYQISHDLNWHIWIVGGVDIKLKNIWLDIIKQRNETNLAIFILNHFREGIHFTHNGWTGYNFLINNINYNHKIHNHGNGDFWVGYHINSHIEALWTEIKKELNKILD